jgi:hypothetical protein
MIKDELFAIEYNFDQGQFHVDNYAKREYKSVSVNKDWIILYIGEKDDVYNLYEFIKFHYDKHFYDGFRKRERTTLCILFTNIIKKHLQSQAKQ